MQKRVAKMDIVTVVVDLNVAVDVVEGTTVEVADVADEAMDEDMDEEMDDLVSLWFAIDAGKKTICPPFVLMRQEHVHLSMLIVLNDPVLPA